MRLTLPFAHLNLRWNPFGEAPREDRARLAVVELPELRPGEIVQFIGEAGRGKTTHLLALEELHPGAVYEHVPEGRRSFESRVPRGGVFLLDEAQRLRPRLLRRLLSRTETLALGTHADLTSFTRRPVRTVRVGGLTLEKLGAIVARRIEWARRGPGPVPDLAAESLLSLIGRHGDDLRAIERELYDLFQRLKEPCGVELHPADRA